MCPKSGQGVHVMMPVASLESMQIYSLLLQYMTEVAAIVADSFVCSGEW